LSRKPDLKDGEDRVKPRRAVIDIGSNTVRLVVYDGPARAPVVLHNEKVMARLGRDIGTSGKIPERAIEQALIGLRRFARVIDEMGIAHPLVVATAAVRDASNGDEVLSAVRSIGLKPRLLSGEEEAKASAAGVIGAFPNASGVVADLGGGSIELLAIGSGDTGHGTSIPLGTLRLAQMREEAPGSFKQDLRRILDDTGWRHGGGQTLYLVGGTWRALAKVANRDLGLIDTDPHGLTIETGKAIQIAKVVARMSPEDIATNYPVAAVRAAALPDAALLLRNLVRQVSPERLVFSAWGLREGLLYAELSPSIRYQDPLIAGVGDFVARWGVSPSLAATSAAWTAAAAGSTDETSERLRLAAVMLSRAASLIETNLRLRHAMDWALHKRWIGIGHDGRGQLATALAAYCGMKEVPTEVSGFAPEGQLRRAFGWGLAARLARRLGAGTRMSTLTSSLEVVEDTLVLWLADSHADLFSDQVERDLANLAAWLGYEGKVVLGAKRK